MEAKEIFTQNNVLTLAKAKQMLDKVGVIVYEKFILHTMRVEGHTDSFQISTAQFPSNWELSSARAVNVLHYLSDFGINESQFSVAGYADNQPRHSNDTPDGRAYNRRVDIIILDEGHF